MATAQFVRRVVQAIVSSARKNFSSVSDANVFELRTYYAKPECMKSFINLCDEHLHLRVNHSPLLGYWTAELGGLNKTIHIWPYESCEHRTKVRTGLANDKDWISTFLTKLFPMLIKQENELLELVPGIALTMPTKPGYYELQKFIFNTTVVNQHKELITFCNKYESKYNEHNSLLIGMFRTLIGSENTAYFLWHHESFDKGLAAKVAFRKEQEATNLLVWKKVKQIESTAMLPIKISPLQ